MFHSIENTLKRERKPIIVLDEYCDRLLDQVQPLARAIIFKRRSGYLSDPAVAAEELYQLILTTDPASLYIIVSPSFGAYTALLFAARYPEHVAGLVLCDPSHPRQGPIALEVLPPVDEFTSEAVMEFRAHCAGFGPIWDEGCRKVSGIVSLGALPLIVLAAGKPEAPGDLPADIYQRLVKDRHSLLEQYARLSSRGEVRIIPEVGHGIVVEAPAIVCRAISDLVAHFETKR